MDQNSYDILVAASDADIITRPFNQTARIWKLNENTVVLATQVAPTGRACPVCGRVGKRPNGWECTMISYGVCTGAGMYGENRKFHCERMETGTVPRTPLWFCKLGCVVAHYVKQIEDKTEQLNRLKEFQAQLDQGLFAAARMLEEHGWLAPDGTFYPCLSREHVNTVLAMGFQSEGAAQSRGCLRLRWYQWEDPSFVDSPPVTQNQINFIAEHAERHQKEIPLWLKAFMAQQSLY